MPALIVRRRPPGPDSSSRRRAPRKVAATSRGRGGRAHQWNRRTRTAVTRTRAILLARTAHDVPVRVNAIDSSRVCPSSQRVSIIRAHVARYTAHATAVPFADFHDTPPPLVTVAGLWFFLAGLFLMITVDGPAVSVTPSRWITPVPFLARPWLHLVLLGVGAACIVAGGGVKSWRLPHLRFLVKPLAALLAVF